MVTTIEQGNTDNTPRCRRCHFWTGNRHGPDNTQGECHRYPPMAAGLVQQQGVAGPQMAVVTAFAVISGLAWCGEFSAAYGPAGLGITP